MLGDYERILRIDEGGDPDSKVMALYRLGRREEALAAWQRAPADAPPTYKAWDEMIVACLSDGPGAREAAERAVGQMSWSDPEGYTTGGIMLCKLGSHDLALLALGKAVDGGYTVTEPLLHDPWLAPLRDNPRFAEILQRAQARRDEALAVFRAEGGERLLGLRSAPDAAVVSEADAERLVIFTISMWSAPCRARARPETRGSRVVRRSGHKTLRIIFLDPHDEVGKPRVLRTINAMGAHYENANGRLYSIDVLPEADFQAVCDFLSHEETESRTLSYESGVTSDADPATGPAGS